jgi:ATP-dependent DNA helicase RecG
VAQQLSLLELLERPTLDALVKPDQVFNSDDWQFVTKHPENTRFDRKSARIAPAALAECLSAFGNGPAVEGGVVVIGVEQDGTVTGCSSVSHEKLQHLEFMGRDSCPDGRFNTKSTRSKKCLGKS